MCILPQCSLELRIRSVFVLEQGCQNITRPATLHFIFPVPASTTTANCSVNKPTEVTCLKFPGRALFLGLRGTFFYHPALLSAFLISLHS